jgi:UDP-2,3-diacylglucosamine pyrophosphatase LpxH
MKLAFRVKQRHIRAGKRATANHCPLALAIKEATGAKTVIVSGDFIETHDENYVITEYHGHDRIQRFQSQFDNRGAAGVRPRTFVIQKIS